MKKLGYRKTRRLPNYTSEARGHKRLFIFLYIWTEIISYCGHHSVRQGRVGGLF
jgi:hypothetical protein